MQETQPSIYKILSGIRVPIAFKEEHFQEVINYKPTPQDVFIVTYPKCGTTWMQNIVLHIYRKGKELENPQDFKRYCPFIDICGNEGLNNMPRPGAFKSHLPYNLMPYSLQSKYINVLRNPKDCCVSLYHHTKKNTRKYGWNADFNEFFEMFMEGDVEYNDYFDHLMSWYPHCNDHQVFFSTYEEMKKDIKNVVRKLAAFLGNEYIEAIEKDNRVLHNILYFSSFEYMKKHLSQVFDSRNGKERNHTELSNEFKEKEDAAITSNKENLPFFRKGEVGDYKIYFSENQSERLKKKLLERTQGTKIVEMYSPFI